VHARPSHCSASAPHPPAGGSTSSGFPTCGFLTGGTSPDAFSSRNIQRRQSHQEASTSGRHALPCRRDSSRCSASRASAPQRAVTQAYSGFRRKMRNRISDKPTGVGSDDGSNEISPCAVQLSGWRHNWIAARGSEAIGRQPMSP